MSCRKLYFIAITASVLSVAAPKCYSQVKIPPRFHDTVNDMLRQNFETIRKSSNGHTAAAHSKVWPLLVVDDCRVTSTTDELLYGVYILVPPIDPKTEFVCLIGDSVTVLDSKDLQSDFKLIADFLRQHSVEKETNQWMIFFQRILEIYDRPKRGSYRLGDCRSIAPVLACQFPTAS
jgi:hypothetical protein